MKVLSKIILTLIIIAFTSGLGACSGLKPSREFYINDFAEVFLEGTRDMIMLEGERLYETTKKKPEGGARLVVLTQLAEKGESIEQSAAKEIFNSWFLGDMDILIFMVFSRLEDNNIQLLSVFLNIGVKMENYVSTDAAVDMIQHTLFNSQWEGELDLGMGHFYYELLSNIYKNAYDYNTFNYDLEDFEDYINEDGVVKKQKPMTAFGYIFSQYSPAWKKVLIISPIILLAAGCFFIFRAKRRI